MKQVVLVRHAKAVPWGYEDDFYRDLTQRGREDAARVGSRLKSMGIQPGLFVSSPARRALETALAFAAVFGYPAEDIEEDPALYPGYAPHGFLEMLRGLSGEHDTLFVFGHNPAMEEYAHSLSDRFYGEVPTCSAIVIRFEADHWGLAEMHGGRLAGHFTPKDR